MLIGELHPLSGTPFHKAYPIFTPFKSCLGEFPWCGVKSELDEEKKGLVYADSQLS